MQSAELNWRIQNLTDTYIPYVRDTVASRNVPHDFICLVHPRHGFSQLSTECRVYLVRSNVNSFAHQLHCFPRNLPNARNKSNDLRYDFRDSRNNLEAKFRNFSSCFLEEMADFL